MTPDAPGWQWKDVPSTRREFGVDYGQRSNVWRVERTWRVMEIDPLTGGLIGRDVTVREEGIMEGEIAELRGIAGPALERLP